MASGDLLFPYELFRDMFPIVGGNPGMNLET